MDYMIGVDIGTTSTKSVAFDLQGRSLSEVSIPYPIYNSRPNWSEQKPEEIFKAVMDSVRTVVAQNKSQRNSLLGIAFSSAMHSLIAVDESGIPMTDCIIWADSRSIQYAEGLKGSKEGHEIYLSTGTPIHPMSPLCKLCWLRDNMSEVFSSAFKFISIKEFVFGKLFGIYAVDYSTASATGLFDIHKFKWNEDSLKIAGITEEKLSELVPPEYIVKGLKEEYVGYLNIDKVTPFIIGASDGCLANLGAGAIKKGKAAVSIGTSGAIRVISDKAGRDSLERIFSYVLTEGSYVLGGAVNNGGIAFNWFKDNFSQAELIEADDTGSDIYEVLMKEAEEIPPGSQGLIFLPYLLGERAPHWDANSRGVYFGINIKHRRPHFLRALLEGIIFSIYSVGKALEENSGDIEVIYATGGFVVSELWVEILADVFNKRVVASKSNESVCLGACILGMKALGIIDNLEEANEFVPVGRSYEPDAEAHRIYMKNFEIFEGLYYNLKDDFTKISRLQEG